MAKAHPKILNYSALWREVIRRRAAGSTYAQIAEDMRLPLRKIARVLSQPEAQAHLAKLLDDMDAELVRSMVYSPWAALLQGGKRRRKHTAGDS